MTQDNSNVILCNECHAPLTDTELEVYPLQWQYSGDMYCVVHETREQFKPAQKTISCSNPVCSETCPIEIDEFSIVDSDGNQFCSEKCYTEVNGDNDACECDICMYVSDVAMSTSDLDYIDGARRGRNGYASLHGMNLAEYSKLLGYTATSELYSPESRARTSFLCGYLVGYHSYTIAE